MNEVSATKIAVTRPHTPTTILFDRGSSYEELTEKMLSIAYTLQRWNDERRTLASGMLTEQQQSRLFDLNSSLDSYSAYLDELGDEMPQGTWIDRANKKAQFTDVTSENQDRKLEELEANLAAFVSDRDALTAMHRAQPTKNTREWRDDMNLKVLQARRALRRQVRLMAFLDGWAA